MLYSLMTRRTKVSAIEFDEYGGAVFTYDRFNNHRFSDRQMDLLQYDIENHMQSNKATKLNKQWYKNLESVSADWAGNILFEFYENTIVKYSNKTLIKIETDINELMAYYGGLPFIEAFTNIDMFERDGMRDDPDILQYYLISLLDCGYDLPDMNDIKNTWWYEEAVEYNVITESQVSKMLIDVPFFNKNRWEELFNR